jgi:hypothetical protein
VAVAAKTIKDPQVPLDVIITNAGTVTHQHCNRDMESNRLCADRYAKHRIQIDINASECMKA